MFGIVFDILFAVFVVGGALFKFLTSSPGQRKERGCLLSIIIVIFIAYFLLLPPEREDKDTISEISIPSYLK